MSNFKIPVNTKNPAEFFACIGLLDFATRVCGDETFGHFETLGNGDVFSLSSPDNTYTLPQILGLLCDTPIKGGESELQFGSYMTLNWWGKKSPLAAWSGALRPSNFLATAQEQLRPHTNQLLDPLNMVTLSLKGSGMITLDARMRNDALDIGFSHDKLGGKEKQPRRQYPATLLLAFLGLQRCQPQDLSYWTWDRPIPSSLTQAATWGLLPGYQKHHLIFQVFEYVPGQSYAVVTFADHIKE